MNHPVRLLALLLLLPGMAGAEPLGRLFYSPAQRAQLDAERNRPNPVVVPETPAEPVRVPPALTYSGVVQRNDGKATLWINNRIVPQGEALSGVAVVGRVRRDGAIRLQLPQSNAAVDLKVGQTLQVDSGTVAEGYARPLQSAKDDIPQNAAAAPAAAPESSRAELRRRLDAATGDGAEEDRALDTMRQSRTGARR